MSLGLLPGASPSLFLSLPLGRNVKQPKKKMSLTSKEENQIYPQRPHDPPPTPRSWIHCWPKKTDEEPCLDWAGSWAWMLCKPELTKGWSILRDCLQSRTFASHLPRPDPANKVAHRLLHLLRAVPDFGFYHGLFGCKEYVLFPPI
jgi:hypothetical protein